MPEYEIFALRYATVQQRTHGENMIYPPGWVRCEELADDPDHIIPGQPEVLRRFPIVSNDPNSVRIDLPPSA